ncbi:fibroblast growth factor receptor 2-like [Orbicella faveolata]|uniref:fibroblast growth factor receptor 2-like n=1 Tax=Orbicella faveolata TaxID=48498 RepID=UPI0009E3A70E|nr:fibroblast growth factor receptor 2-like [Orbicella faveolata]
MKLPRTFWQRKIIHRDLAAPNVLTVERKPSKVTDFGMVRDVQQVNIYEKTTKGRRPPIKWTAYEVLLYGTYTTKSAVWRYGVVLYGIFTIGNFLCLCIFYRYFCSIRDKET